MSQSTRYAIGAVLVGIIVYATCLLTGNHSDAAFGFGAVSAIVVLFSETR